jgi:site-specific DNA-methyltransferase (adenine-specific)
MSKVKEPVNIHPISYEYSDNKWKLAIGKNNYGRLKGHSLHYVGPYSGSFPPELVHYFLYKYTNPNDVVLDPFSGRGTTNLQSVLNNRRTIANDINPLAFTYTFSKLFPIPSRNVERLLDKVPFYDESYIDPLDETKKDELLAYFHEDTLREIQILKKYLMENKSFESTYIQSLLVGTLRGNRISNLSVTMSALICFSANYMRSWSEKTGIFPEYREVKSRLISKAERLEKDGLSFRSDSIVLQEDSTNLQSIKDNSIDCIITSPPYFNVINYAYDNRLRLWSLGYDHKEIQKQLCHTSSIPKYTDFIDASISEMFRVLKDDSWTVIVVGDVKKKNYSTNKSYYLNTAEIIADIAKKHGFSVEKIINDALPDEKGTCGRATSITNSISVKLDRCVVLKKGQAEEKNHKVDWNKLINPKIS